MKLILSVGALAVSVSACAVQPDSTLSYSIVSNSKIAAVSTATKPATSFGYLDTDKDGRLSRQEARADWAVMQRFSAGDTNHDGFLDQEEFKQLSRS